MLTGCFSSENIFLIIVLGGKGLQNNTQKIQKRIVEVKLFINNDNYWLMTRVIDNSNSILAQNFSARVQNESGISLIKKMMADSSSLYHQQPLQNQEFTAKLPIQSKEKKDFILTEGQKIYIQHHLPKTFALIPVSGSFSRLTSNSKTLVEESITFIERKRGRPEGSRRKNINKVQKERKSMRIASSSRLSCSSLQQKSSYSSGQSNLNEGLEIFQQNDDQLCQKKQEPEINAIDKDIDASLEEKLPKIFKESEKIPELADALLEGQLLETPIKREEQQLKDNPNEQKTQPSNKQFTDEMPVFHAQRSVLRRLKAHREIYPFLEPVDELRDGAPDYYKQISCPIDLQTIEFKLTTGIYKLPEDFHADIRMMWANAKAYNKKNNYMMKITQELETYYLHLLSKPRCGRKKKLEQ